MMIEEILKNTVSEISEQIIPNIKINEGFGYENFFHSGKEAYAKRLGRELIKNNIPFDSLFEIGYGKFDDEEKNNEFAQSYTEICKQTPNYIFLKDILPVDIQRDVLLKTIKKFDFKACLDGSVKDNFTKLTSILNILRDFRSIGVDKCVINKEITDIIKDYAIKTKYCHPNSVTAFINEGFFFDEEFIKKDFYHMFKYTFGHMGTYCDERFNQVYCSNKENRIKYDYNNMNQSLTSKEDKTTIKRKI